jgi:hypothetical protein
MKLYHHDLPRTAIMRGGPDANNALSMRCSWPDWEGPKVTADDDPDPAGYASCGMIVESLTHGDTRNHYCAPIKITEVDHRGTVTGVICYTGDTHCKAMNGEIVRMKLRDLWVPVDRLWAVRHAEEIAEGLEAGATCGCGSLELAHVYGGGFECAPCRIKRMEELTKSLKPEKKPKSAKKAAKKKVSSPSKKPSNTKGKRATTNETTLPPVQHSEEVKPDVMATPDAVEFWTLPDHRSSTVVHHWRKIGTDPHQKQFAASCGSKYQPASKQDRWAERPPYIACKKCIAADAKAAAEPPVQVVEPLDVKPDCDAWECFQPANINQSARPWEGMEVICRPDGGGWPLEKGIVRDGRGSMDSGWFRLVNSRYPNGIETHTQEVYPPGFVECLLPCCQGRTMKEIAAAEEPVKPDGQAREGTPGRIAHAALPFPENMYFSPSSIRHPQPLMKPCFCGARAFLHQDMMNQGKFDVVCSRAHNPQTGDCPYWPSSTLTFDKAATVAQWNARRDLFFAGETPPEEIAET